MSVKSIHAAVASATSRLYSPSPLFFAPNFVMKSLLYGQACEKKQISPLSLYLMKYSRLYGNA